MSLGIGLAIGQSVPQVVTSLTALRDVDGFPLFDLDGYYMLEA